MPVDILLAIIVVSVIQSIFWVGILLFGTPILLLLGYEFVEALGVLLPVSIAVNALQFVRHYDDLDTHFYKNILLYTMPMVVGFLWLVTSVKMNVGFVIGGVLIFVSLKSFLPIIERLLKSIVVHEQMYLLVMAVVHGMSNLGGSMLTIIYAKTYTKDKTRVTAAASYATVATCQLITLLLLGTQFTVAFADKVTFVQIGIILFLVTEELVYKNIDNEKYSKLFAVFLFYIGYFADFKILIA